MDLSLDADRRTRFLNLYLQQVLGLGAFASGAAPIIPTIMVTASGQLHAGALTDGFSAGLLGAAGIAASGAILAWVWLRTASDLGDPDRGAGARRRMNP